MTCDEYRSAVFSLSLPRTLTIHKQSGNGLVTINDHHNGPRPGAPQGPSYTFRESHDTQGLHPGDLIHHWMLKISHHCMAYLPILYKLHHPVFLILPGSSLLSLLFAPHSRCTSAESQRSRWGLRWAPRARGLGWWRVPGGGEEGLSPRSSPDLNSPWEAGHAPETRKRTPSRSCLDTVSICSL